MCSFSTFLSYTSLEVKYIKLSLFSFLKKKIVDKIIAANNYQSPKQYLKLFCNEKFPQN